MLFYHTVHVVFPSPFLNPPRVVTVADMVKFREWREAFVRGVDEITSKMDALLKDGWLLEWGRDGELLFAHPGVWSIDDAVKRLQALGYTGSDVGSDHDAPEIKAEFHDDRPLPF